MGFRLTDILATAARDHAERVALTFDADPPRAAPTYAGLARTSARVSVAMAAAGIGHDDRVVWIGKNRPEFVELLFGALAVRAVMAPLNVRLTADELAAITADALAPLVVLGPDVAALREPLAALDTVRRVLVVGEDYEDWLDGATDGATDAVFDPPADGRDDDTVLQLYTSGTTGLPKGVLLTHVQFDALLRVGEHWGLDGESVALVAMPLHHIGGAGFALMSLAFAARTVLVGDIVPDRLLDTMESERVTTTFLVPAVLAALVAVDGAAERDWSALRAIAYGASPITSPVLRRVLDTFGAPLFQVYGATETTGAICRLEPADHDPDGPRAHLMRSAGRPYEWVEIKAVDPDTGEDRAPGVVGEIWIRSSQVTPGYWRRPDETAAALTDEHWLRTGDAGYLDDEGYVFLTDRIKDMIVTGAENVYPIEVEEVLAGHPDVADVAVIGVPDERWGETVRAVVVPAPGVTLDVDALLAWARERLAGFKRPRAVDVVDALPRNAGGKVLKKELRAPYWADAGRSIG